MDTYNICIYRDVLYYLYIYIYIYMYIYIYSYSNPRADPHMVFSILETLYLLAPGLHHHAGRPAVRVALPGSSRSGVAADADEDSSSTPTLALQLCGTPLRLQA